MSLKSFIILCLFILSLASCGRSIPEPADMVIKNGKIYTMDEGEPQVEAIAVAERNIIATGKYGTIEKFIVKKLKSWI